MIQTRKSYFDPNPQIVVDRIGNEIFTSKGGGELPMRRSVTHVKKWEVADVTKNAEVTQNAEVAPSEEESVAVPAADESKDVEMQEPINEKKDDDEATEMEVGIGETSESQVIFRK